MVRHSSCAAEDHKSLEFIGQQLPLQIGAGPVLAKLVQRTIPLLGLLDSLDQDEEVQADEMVNLYFDLITFSG